VTRPPDARFAGVPAAGRTKLSSGAPVRTRTRSVARRDSVRRGMVPAARQGRKKDPHKDGITLFNREGNDPGALGTGQLRVTSPFGPDSFAAWSGHETQVRTPRYAGPLSPVVAASRRPHPGPLPADRERVKDSVRTRSRWARTLARDTNEFPQTPRIRGKSVAGSAIARVAEPRAAALKPCDARHLAVRKGMACDGKVRVDAPAENAYRSPAFRQVDRFS
jgi:hypothetical protein